MVVFKKRRNKKVSHATFQVKSIIRGANSQWERSLLEVIQEPRGMSKMGNKIREKGAGTDLVDPYNDFKLCSV